MWFDKPVPYILCWTSSYRPVQELLLVKHAHSSFWKHFINLLIFSLWFQVNQRNEWGNIVKQFDNLKHCVNGEVALKQVYLR